ncbi:4Fe-4S binding protein [Deinococcus aquiradiocola]|uniref:Polyferredoxin n=1 Tax=Deinococcus aquiradiocola TaxID=393059 RepID=A0A917P484_9DEIO|nr:4Fe-4S binding protein [Deinococcus aquiradiocola]GGJ60848.1 polyferredoxin [Deinococcus aquiradiocola]
MLDGVFKLLGEYGNMVPRYTGPRCLSERLSVGGCDLCQTACPHDAILIPQSVVIDPAACTGCGLCVQACPSGALEYDVTAPLNAVREQKTGAARGQEPEAKLVCSRSEEGGKALPCLGRVTVSTVMAAGAWDVPLTLVHGDCGTCTLGGPDVPESVARVVQDANLLRGATGRASRVTVRPHDPARAGSGETVSRRGVFGALARGARTMAAQSIPDSPLPFVDWSEPEDRVPSEWQWRVRALRPAPAPDAPVHWPAPVVDDTCIDCPVCANVCPTDAITRDVQPDGSVTLTLALAACTGCRACEASCPPQAIRMQPEWRFEALEALVLLRDSGNILQ